MGLGVYYKDVDERNLNVRSELMNHYLIGNLKKSVDKVYELNQGSHYDEQGTVKSKDNNINKRN